MYIARERERDVYIYIYIEREGYIYIYILGHIYIDRGRIAVGSPGLESRLVAARRFINMIDIIRYYIIFTNMIIMIKYDY